MTGRSDNRSSAQDAGGLPAQTALHRLQQFQQDHKALWHDMLENWTGWAFSLLFHLTVFILLAVFIVAVPVAVKEIPNIFSDLRSMPQFDQETLPDLFPTPADSAAAEFPSFDDKPTQARGVTDLEPGPPDYIGLGPLTGPPGNNGRGDGGPGDPTGPFKGVVDKANRDGLDVVFVFDSTGSMGGIISETRTRIRQLMGVVQHLVPGVRVAIVTYRDLREFDPADFEYTVKIKGFTTDVKQLEAFLRNVQAIGGGDQPEAVYQALDTAMHKLSWGQNSKKVIILFGDAPPRPENDGLNKLYQMCGQWHKRTGGIVSCIDTTGRDIPGYRMMPEFQDIAKAGGGEAMLLDNPRDLISQLAVYVFGSKWKGDVESVMKWYVGGPSESIIIEEK